MLRPVLPVGVLAACVLVLAGCGGGDGSSASSATSSTSTSATSSSTASSTSTSATSSPVDDHAHGEFPEPGSTVGPGTFKDAITAGAVIIDVRTPQEFAQGHIAGAVNHDIESARGRAALAALDPSKHYAVYCRSGNRSRTALEIMNDAGVEQAFDLDGGVELWQQVGNELVTGD